MPTAFAPQPLPRWHRAVLKVGSSLLTTAEGSLTGRHAEALATFVARSRSAGREVVIVSSGAVAAGRGLATPERQSQARDWSVPFDLAIGDASYMKLAH